MPTPSKLLAPLKNAITRSGDDKHSQQSAVGALTQDRDQPQPLAHETCIVRDYAAVPRVLEAESSIFSLDTQTRGQPQLVTTSPDSYPPTSSPEYRSPNSGVSVHPFDVQSNFSSASTARFAEEVESEGDEGHQDLTDEQLKRLYDDEEIERFLTHVTEVTLASSADTGEPGKSTVLRSNRGRDGTLGVEVLSVDDSDAETDVDEPWTYLNTANVPSEPNTAAALRSQRRKPQSYPQQPPKYLSARVAAWIIPKLPLSPATPRHKFRLSSFRLGGQRLWVATYPFYAPLFEDLAQLAAWTNWHRSARTCSVWWILWYFNLLLPALFGKILFVLLRRRMLPNPNLKELRERRRLAREANQLGDTMEGHGAATSFLGTGPVPGIGQGGGDMGIRDMWKLVGIVTKGKSKKGKEKVKDAGETVASQLGMSVDVDRVEETRRGRQEDEDWRRGALKIMEGLADFHERVRNLFLWRREMSSRIYTLVLFTVILFTALAPAQLLAKTTYAIIGIIYWFVVPVVLAMPPEDRKRIPPPLFDVPSDAEYAISLMSIRVANGESVVPASLRTGREHGRARRFLAGKGVESIAKGKGTTNSLNEGAEWEVASPTQDIGSMRDEANEREAEAIQERAAARGDFSAVQGIDAQSSQRIGPTSPKVGTLGRLKNRLEKSTADLLATNEDDSSLSLQSIGAPQTVPANHKATPGTLVLNSEGICFIPLLKSSPRMRISLESIQGVKKTTRTNGLRIRHLDDQGDEHEVVFRFIPSRDEIFGKLVGWGGRRWKKVP